MNKRAVFKGIALVNFIALITAFLMYKNGNFDRPASNVSEIKQSSPNGGAPAQTMFFDSSGKIMFDSPEMKRLASSKSMVIIDPKKIKLDTTKVKPAKGKGK